MPLEPVIGLEIHAQLLTATKIFCGCRTTFGAPPNTQTCPVCLGLPGALPVLNRRAVELAIRAALALHGNIAPESVFARKHYFYPDLPKGYQISQYDRPLATGGWIEPAGRSRVGLVRLHLEEDAGRSLHDRATAGATGLDFNRSGVPLIEIVTAPDLRSPADAAACFEAVRDLLVALGVTDGNMEEGSLRCDANVSVRPRGAAGLGTKTEVKNLNSFRFLQQALDFEVRRQSAIVESGGVVDRDTRLWDRDRSATVSMRGKEDVHDYRYFPEPDLPPLVVDRPWVDRIRAGLAETPEARRRRLAATYGLSAQDVDVLVRVLDDGGEYFEAVVRAGASPRAASTWVQGEVRRKLKALGLEGRAHVAIAPAALAELARLTEQGVVSSSAAKTVFEAMWTTGRSAQEIIDAGGLRQIDDREWTGRLVARVLAEHPAAVSEFRGGRKSAFGFLVGEVMQLSEGKANPRLVATLLQDALDERA